MKLREAWPPSARLRSIAARQQQAKLRKVRFYLNTSTPGLTAGDFSSRAGFKDPPKMDKAETATKPDGAE